MNAHTRVFPFMQAKAVSSDNISVAEATPTFPNRPAPRRSSLGALLGLCLGFAAHTQLANAQRPPMVYTNAAEWATYQNNRLFAQLSGAARTRAEMKFGKKPARGPKFNPTGSGQESSGSTMLLGPASFSPVPNPRSEE